MGALKRLNKTDRWMVIGSCLCLILLIAASYALGQSMQAQNASYGAATPVSTDAQPSRAPASVQTFDVIHDSEGGS